MPYVLKAEWTTGGVPVDPVVCNQRQGEEIGEFEARFDGDVAAAQAINPPDPPEGE
jgi:hypothetical protein